MNATTCLALLIAAALLSVERLAYVYVWRYPAAFRRICARTRIAENPVSGLERLFYGFKLIQIGVFTAWILGFSGGFPQLGDEPFAALVGGLLIVAGQALNFGAFWRLGRVGIFYGIRFGHEVPWCTRFPFSLVRHPQYVGTVLSIWGLFLACRFPHADWLLIPLLQTFYYCAGAFFESAGADPAEEAGSDAPFLVRAQIPAFAESETPKSR